MKAKLSPSLLRIVAVLGLMATGGAAQADSGYIGIHFGPGNPYLADYRSSPPPRHDHQWRHDRPGHGGFTDRVDDRQERQRDVIHQGIRSGELTRREAGKLMHQQREIEWMQRNFLADGHLSRNEYWALDRALDQARQDIRHQLRDNEQRW